MVDETRPDEPVSRARRLETPSHDSVIEYRRLRSPSQHGQSLLVPDRDQIERLWNQNLALANSRVTLAEHPLEELHPFARGELIKLATSYSQSYSQIDVAARSHSRILLAGHQPELFHPGVWYKNFVLSELGSRFGATPINLVVDNDICGNASIQFPGTDGDSVHLGSIPLVPAGPNIPFEERTIDDLGYFHAFQDRAADAIQTVVPQPIVDRLWPHVMHAVSQLSSSAKPNLGQAKPKLGQAIAAGRHRLEQEIGLKTLEIPVSLISQTQAFAIFLKSILLDADQFRKVYNQSLSDYRKANRIRSRSHPVPELETRDGWLEVPFWIWQVESPNRRGLFVKRSRDTIVLSDRLDWQSKFPVQSFVEQVLTLGNQGVAIRPRALTTTMYSRLVLSDLFLHGIGGAKYDQLTDVIMKRFFLVQPPGFLTLSATMKLPTELNIVRRTDLVRTNQLIRDLKFHPESHIRHPSPEAQQLIQQKRDWTIGAHQGERSRQKHEAIVSLNARLARHVEIELQKVLATRSKQLTQIRAGEILDSREYSFCLFPESLIGELERLATV